MSEEDRLNALAWLNGEQARTETEDLFNAEAFAIVVTTVESGSAMTWVHGPVASQVEALRLAELHERQLNDGLAVGDVPFTAKVYPMNRPEGWE